MPEPQPKGPRRVSWWETVAIFLAIAAIWPAYILKWPGVGWRVVSYVALAAMVVVLARRLLAFERIRNEADAARRSQAGQQGRARPPWEPPGPPGDDA